VFSLRALNDGPSYTIGARGVVNRNKESAGGGL